MKRKILASVVMAVTLLATGAALAVGMMHRGMARHHQGMMGGIPEPYNGMRNPVPDSKQAVKEGQELYQTYCASCHGKQGYGD